MGYKFIKGSNGLIITQPDGVSIDLNSKADLYLYPAQIAVVIPSSNIVLNFGLADVDEVTGVTSFADLPTLFVALEAAFYTAAAGGGGSADFTATNAKIDTTNTKLTSIDGKTPALNGDGGALVHVTNANSDPATGTKQTAAQTSLTSIDGKLTSDPATATKQTGMQVSLTSMDGKSGVMEQLTTASGSALNAELFNGDVSRYSSLVFSIQGASAATVSFQGRNNTTDAWQTCRFETPDTGAVSSSAANVAQFSAAGVVTYRYFRLLVSVYTSGTITCNLMGCFFPIIGKSVSLANSIVFSPSTTSGGYSTFHKLIAAATTNATSVKASVGNIGSIQLCNLSAAVKFFKLYNKASAPTVGTDTPVKVILIPAGQTIVLSFPMGIRLLTGIAYAITGAYADSDTTAVAAGDVIVNIDYV